MELHYTHQNENLTDISSGGSTSQAARPIDNPDQRICSDINEFTLYSLKLFFLFLDAVVNLFLFSYVLFKIFPLLYVVVLIYSIVGTIVTMWIGYPLPSKFFARFQKEADFRFGIIRTRDNAESIAFYDCDGHVERNGVLQLLARVVNIQLDIVRKQLHIEYFTKSYEYGAFVVPMFLLAPLYFSGRLDFGALSQANDAFFNIRSDFSIFINNYEDMSVYLAVVDRLDQFLRKIDQLSPLVTDGSSPAVGGSSPLHVGDSVSDEKSKLLPLVNKPSTIVSSHRSNAPAFSSYWASLFTTRDRFSNSGASTDPSSSRYDESGVALPLLSGASYTQLTPSMLPVTQSHFSQRSGFDPLVGPAIGYVSFDEATQIRTYWRPLTSRPNASNTLSTLVECINLTVATPDGAETILGATRNTLGQLQGEGINLTINRQDRVIITGVSGVGKSSLLRALAGLWTSGSGIIAWYGLPPRDATEPFSSSSSSSGRPSSGSALRLRANKGVMFLAQKPYNLISSLIDQIVYPDTYSEVETAQTSSHNWSASISGEYRSNSQPDTFTNIDDLIMGILHSVRLEDLPRRMGGGDLGAGLRVVKDWSKVSQLIDLYHSSSRHLCMFL